jgi:hypothetical protein
MHETLSFSLDLPYSSSFARGSGNPTYRQEPVIPTVGRKITDLPRTQNGSEENGRKEIRSKHTRQEQSIPAFRELSLLYVEELFRTLRGEALLIAALSYGLAVSVDALRQVRMRDVGLFDRTILVRGKEYPIPRGITDDLREFFQERICGCDASVAFGSSYSHASPNTQPRFLGGASIQNDLLFSSSAFSSLEESAQNTVNAVVQTHTANAHQREISVSFNFQLKILARAHRRYAALRKHLITSPLDLFDKGPRIVRRGRGGVVSAYYLWRAARIVVGR